MSFRLKTAISYMQDWIKPHVEGYKRVDYLVEILLGDIYGKFPDNATALLERRGYTRDQIANMKPMELLEAFSDVRDELPSSGKTLGVALELLFQERYGWPPGTVNRMTFPEIQFALEEALDYTPPGKPSIWELTRS